MQDVVDQCVDSFWELAHILKSTLRKVPTPFIDEPNDPKEMETPLPKDADATTMQLTYNGN